MNVEIAVGSIGVSFTAILVEPIATSRQIFVIEQMSSPMTFSRSSIISLNGHSLSAINPNAQLIGGETTLR
jgi:hypothetical protein